MLHKPLLALTLLAVSPAARAADARLQASDTLPPPTRQQLPSTRPDTLGDTSRPVPLPPADTSRQNLRDSITFLGVGDIMLGTDFPSPRYLPPDDGAHLLKPVTAFIEEADVAFGNLEGTFLSGDHPGKKCRDTLVCYAFKMPERYVQHLKEAGFDILSVANNHINDFGEKGACNTVDILRQAGIHHAGLTSCPTAVFRLDDLTIGFTAFAPNTGTMNFNDHARAARIVQALDTSCDIVVVSFHGGAEGATMTRVTREDEHFVGENRGNPYRFARAAIDAGADIVFGHGPHVTRAIDLYRDRLICYSLGNFATYGRFNLSGISGIAPMVRVTVNRRGEFRSALIRSIHQPGEGGPMPDTRQRALREIVRLTRSDIPEAPLDILPDGTVRKRKTAPAIRKGNAGAVRKSTAARGH
jgi:poly-gamma-glutamate capsule biosynthesis protein CapA/YwtB (metallophosphatase superfamily)